MNIVLAIALVVACSSGVFLIGATMYIKLGWFRRLFHDIFHWHRPNERVLWDGCSFCSVCKYCKKPIKRDSQGNWF